MGFPRLYYYPDLTTFSTGAGASLEVVDFGERISDIQITPVRKVADSVSLTGRTSRLSWAPGLKVRIIQERFTDDALARDLYAFQSHVERGLLFGFSADSAKTYASSNVAGRFYRGDSSPTVSGNIFSAWESAATLAADDIVHISGPPPSHTKEEGKVVTFSAGVVNLSSALLFDHDTPAILRYRDFFPVMFLPESEVNKPLLSHDHRISYTFDMTATLYPWWSFVFANEGLILGGDTDVLVDPEGLGALDTIDGLAGATVSVMAEPEPDGPDTGTTYRKPSGGPGLLGDGSLPWEP